MRKPVIDKFEPIVDIGPRRRANAQYSKTFLERRGTKVGDKRCINNDKRSIVIKKILNA